MKRMLLILTLFCTLLISFALLTVYLRQQKFVPLSGLPEAAQAQTTPPQRQTGENSFNDFPMMSDESLIPRSILTLKVNPTVVAPGGKVRFTATSPTPVSAMYLMDEGFGDIEMQKSGNSYSTVLKADTMPDIPDEPK